MHSGHEDLNSNYNGCFSDGGDSDNNAASGSGSGLIAKVNINASKSSSIYGKSSTVQPNSAQILIIIKTWALGVWTVELLP